MKLIFLISFLATCTTSISHQSVAMDLFKNLNVKQCIFIENKILPAEKLFKNVKKLSSNNIASTIILNNYIIIFSYLEFKQDHFNVGLLATDESLGQLNILAQMIDKVKFSKYVKEKKF